MGDLMSPSDTLRPVPLLTAGAHKSIDAGACVMEAVAYVAGEPWSDHPQCACPVPASFARSLNDRAWPTDQDRTDALGPLVPLLVGTRNVALESKRRWLFADAAVRQFAPLALERRWPNYAAKLRALPPVTANNWREARAVCWEAKADAADAYAVAYAADAVAYAAAYAAEAAADDAAATATDAAAAAAAAAVAAAADAAADAARLKILRLAADVLRQAIEIKEPA
jgi:hypothetical protein